MFADTVIAEALATDLRRHSAEKLKVIPNFRDVSIGELRLERMNWCSTRDVMVKEIDAAPGVYPVVWSVKVKPRRPQQEPGASGAQAAAGHATNQSKAGRMIRSQPFEDFIRDEEASISLWTIPLDHACVPNSERCGEMPDPGEGGELEPQTTSHRSEHAPQDPQDIRISKAIRVALDFTMRDGRPMRRTGIVLLKGQKVAIQSNSRVPEDLSSMGWSVRWDNWQWFAGMQVSLIVPMPPSRPVGSGSGSPSDPIDVQDDESRFVVLAWKERMPNSNVEGNVGSDGSIVTMIFKKHDTTSGQSEPVEFTEEEKRAFGIGLSEGDEVRISTVS
ncbi:hypothetical protein GSI_01604 [Ganoderma sinense ZZ0214-1]|uniref:Uncharacterized protein n=1 Tax=Ganoderma sinense ZZ0214-1 TaxID=1077348 RepID=A0A2G8SQA5_9APHY|nr:hypothetical protein GSI_01604 [Ganoderma sinense ZZ0214-1]